MSLVPYAALSIIHTFMNILIMLPSSQKNYKTWKRKKKNMRQRNRNLQNETKYTIPELLKRFKKKRVELKKK